MVSSLQSIDLIVTQPESHQSAIKKPVYPTTAGCQGVEDDGFDRRVSGHLEEGPRNLSLLSGYLITTVTDACESTVSGWQRAPENARCFGHSSFRSASRS